MTPQKKILDNISMKYKRFFPKAERSQRVKLDFQFDVLLTVHLSIFISVINQLDAHKFVLPIGVMIPEAV